MFKRFILNSRGFTLSELLLATLILAFAITMFLQGFVSSMLANYINRNASIASTHVQYVMEEIKSTRFGDIKTKINNGDWNWAATNIISRGMLSLANEFVNTTVSGTSLLDVTVTASWRDIRGGIRNVSSQTFFSQP